MRNPFSRTPISPQDAIERQLHQVERQGGGMTTLAHGASFALVVAFSAGSLVALAGDALTKFITEWRAGVVDVPALISFVVSFLLVVCMDTALVVAAATVRMLLQRRQSGVLLHALVIVGVSLVEAATYLYMSWLYDHPTSWVVWVLIGLRSLSAPLTAVYLSLSRTLPIGKRDILYQVEMVTGRGVIVDVTRIAADPDATTERKLALYRAATADAKDDDARLDEVIIAARIGAPSDGAADSATAEAAIGAVANDILRFANSSVFDVDTHDDDSQPQPPTDGGSPHSGPTRPPRRRRASGSANVTPMRRRGGLGRGYTGDRRASNGQSLEAEARAAWADGARTVSAMVKRTGMSQSAAGSWVRSLKAEQRTTHPAAAVATSQPASAQEGA